MFSKIESEKALQLPPLEIAKKTVQKKRMSSKKVACPQLETISQFVKRKLDVYGESSSQPAVVVASYKGKKKEKEPAKEKVSGKSISLSM